MYMALVRCVGFRATPISHGFVDFGEMFAQAVMPYEPWPFNLKSFMMNTLTDLNEKHIGSLRSFSRVLQDMLSMCVEYAFL